MDKQVTMDECLFNMDGNQWCCTLSDFTNLQESPAGFGDTQEEAFDNLMEDWENG